LKNKSKQKLKKSLYHPNVQCANLKVVSSKKKS